MTILNGAGDPLDSSAPVTQVTPFTTRLRNALAALYRYARRFAVGIGVTLAVIVVSTITIDLGPALRSEAERRGGDWVQRKMTIGRLGVHLGRGRFILDNVRVEGLTAGDRPWLVAKRVEVSLTWAALLHKEVLLDTIEMSDWRMVIETFPNGRHTWPRVTGPPRKPNTDPNRVVTTTQFLQARRGEVVFEDHGVPWGAVARNLEVTVSKLGEYRGQARFTGGTISIQKYEPMAADLVASFKIVGPRILFDRIDITSDGAQSSATGAIDISRWPEQTYNLKSRIQFPRMREIFFARDTFSLSGEGDFTGTYHLFKGGRELKGNFTSVEAGVNAYRFPRLEGSLIWVSDRFEVTRARSGFSGGEMAFRYVMAPLGKPEPARAQFDVDYTDVDLSQLTQFYETRGIRLAGRASGRNEMNWPLGRFAEGTGHGTVSASAPGVALQGARLAAGAADAASDRAGIPGPFANHLPLEPVNIGGELVYTFDPEAVRFEPSHIATEDTYVSFEGATAWGERSKMPFRVISRNWQESDRFLAGLMTAFGATTSAIPIDGVGQFQGVMLGSFRRPRIEGKMTGSSMRAWDVIWGEVEGDFVVENAYANVSRVSIRSGLSRMDVSGQFSLGFPRADGGEEIDARIRIEGRGVPDFLEAFNLEDYEVDGVLSGDFHLYGQYTQPFGFGRMTIDRGTAYGEPFSSASGSLRFEGTGVRIDAIDLRKGGGVVTGASYIGWNGTYAFDVDARHVAVDTLALTSYPGYPPLTGLLEFNAFGRGNFESPRYEVKASVSDLFLGEEGVGHLTGRLSVRDTLVTYEFEAASARLAVSGTGRVELNDERDAELSFQVTDTSLDPYFRAMQPGFSAFTSAVASGSIRVVGELYNANALRVDTTVDRLEMKFLDYRLRNDRPIHVSVDRQMLQLDSLKLVGDETEIELTGSIDLPRQTLALQANGAANLAVLQGFVPNLRSSGRAEVSARISGTESEPIMSGNALLTDGRLRQFDFPHALENLNGIVTFNESGVRLDGVTGRLGGGLVRFGGRVGLVGYQLSEYDVTAVGEDLRLRFPEGMRSTVDANFAVQGRAETPTVTGTILVKNASWSRGFDTTSGLFSGLTTGGDPALPLIPGQVNDPGAALRFDVRILAPSTVRIENDRARIVASADLTLRGTFERPLLFGHADIDRGEVEFEGRRYLVTRGSLDFANPNRIQPFFDVEAETRVRVPGETYRITLRMAGTTERLQPEFSSDPPLASLDILTLLFSDRAPSGDTELAGLQRPNEREQRLVEARAARALTGALSAEVGRVVEQTFGVDTFQVTPLLSDPYQHSARLNVNPTARVTIGKRISNRIFLTYARTLSSSTRDEIILLEFDESDTLSWVLSQNEDRTYALEVRKRHTF
jgi:hypothetical protein